MQVLKNRGYALDSGEEELRKKLVALEGMICDPALSGRGEEIWARMVSIRERGRTLEREFEKAGRNMDKSGEINEAVFKRCREVCGHLLRAQYAKLKWRQILDNHSSQILHLAAELEQLRKEFAERNEGQKSGVNLGR